MFLKVTDESGEKGYDVKSLQPEAAVLDARAASPPPGNSGNKSSEGELTVYETGLLRVKLWVGFMREEGDHGFEYVEGVSRLLSRNLH